MIPKKKNRIKGLLPELDENKSILPNLDNEKKVIELINEKDKLYFLYPSFGNKYVKNIEKLMYRTLEKGRI